MKKLVSLLCLSSLFFVGCNAHAQSNSVVVGNPGSANTLILEHGYGVIETYPAGTPSSPSVNAPTPAAIQPNSNPNPATMQPQPVGGAVLLETVTESTAPNNSSLEIDDTLMPVQ